MTAFPRSAALLCAAVAALIPSTSTLATGAGWQATTQHVRVSVLDPRNVPVTGLTAADFIVREDGVAREVLAVTTAAPADHIVLLVDDSAAIEPNVLDVREGVRHMVTALLAVDTPPNIRITTFGDRPTVRTDFTTSSDSLMRTVDRIVASPGAGATLLEAIVETARDVRTRGLKEATVVAFVAEAGPEFSSTSRQQVAETVRTTGLTLWGIQLTQPAGPDMSDAGRERASVMGDVTTSSGGTTRLVLGRQGIVPAFEAIATALTSGYDVAYGRPDRLIPPSRIEISTRESDYKVLARRWPAQ